MNLKAAMDYMANNYESMIAESASMIGVYVPPTIKPALPVAQFFSLSYEPMVKDDPSMGAYCIDLLLPSLQDMPANRVSIYGDSVEELRAAAGNDYAVEADYSTVLPPPPCSPDVEEMLDAILADFKKRIQP